MQLQVNYRGKQFISCINAHGTANCNQEFIPIISVHIKHWPKPLEQSSALRYSIYSPTHRGGLTGHRFGLGRGRVAEPK